MHQGFFVVDGGRQPGRLCGCITKTGQGDKAGGGHQGIPDHRFEFRAVDQGFQLRVVVDVTRFFGGVTVIDIDGNGLELEGRQADFGIFGAVVGVDADRIARCHAPATQPECQPGGAVFELAESQATRAADQGFFIRFGVDHQLKKVGKIVSTRSNLHGTLRRIFEIRESGAERVESRRFYTRQDRFTLPVGATFTVALFFRFNSRITEPARPWFAPCRPRHCP